MGDNIHVIRTKYRYTRDLRRGNPIAFTAECVMSPISVHVLCKLEYTRYNSNFNQTKLGHGKINIRWIGIVVLHIYYNNIWPASCEMGPLDMCKKFRPRPDAASLTQRLIRFCTFCNSSHQ